MTRNVLVKPDVLETIRRMPAIEHGLVRGRPWLVYDALRHFLPVGIAGGVLLELTRTTDGWEDLAPYAWSPPSPPESKEEEWVHLQERERTVLFMLGEGLDAPTIADVLQISHDNVARTCGRLKFHFGVPRRDLIVREARCRGLLR